MGIESIFIALEPSAKQLHTAASPAANFVKNCSSSQPDESSKTVQLKSKLSHEESNTAIRPRSNGRPDETLAIIQKQAPHSDQVQHKCDICHKEFTSESNLKRHKTMLHENRKSLSCDACGKKFSMLCRLKQHMVVHSDDLPYSCNVCSKNFKSAVRLGDHTKIHASLDFSCVECGKQFSRVKYLKRHMVTHTGKEHLCQVCGKQFTYSKELLRHIVVSHGDSCQAHGQQSCDVNTESILKSTELSGLITRQHECLVCKKSFKSKTVLKTHMFVHSNERKFRCDWCGQRFKLKGSLRGHIRAKHTSNKPHTCSICGHAFVHFYQLKCHKLKHEAYGPNWLPNERSGNEKLTCSQCGKVFLSAVSLWGHMSAHSTRTSFKPFACNACDKKFARQKSLRRHFRNQHPVGRTT